MAKVKEGQSMDEESRIGIFDASVRDIKISNKDDFAINERVCWPMPSLKCLKSSIKQDYLLGSFPFLLVANWHSQYHAGFS